MKLTHEEVKAYMKGTLEKHGLYVEEAQGNGLSISLTQFGLSTVYAAIDADEIRYCMDNLDEDEYKEWKEESDE